MQRLLHFQNMTRKLATVMVMIWATSASSYHILNNVLVNVPLHLDVLDLSGMLAPICLIIAT